VAERLTADQEGLSSMVLLILESSLSCGMLRRVVWLLFAWLILKVEAICSSETSDDFQRTTCRYIPEDRTPLTVVSLAYSSIL
jgi:hypothetical protein